MSPRPGYLGLAKSGQLVDRVSELAQLLESCTACPRSCEIDRSTTPGICATGTEPIVASWTPHFGEEPVISGRRGSGTVFLASCNLGCVYCQNHDISQNRKSGAFSEISVEELAAIFLDLQDRGCHNINWVSPTHQVPQLALALRIAAMRGLSIPIVYNSNGYDSVTVLRLLEDIVDVYMPDLKYSDAEDGLMLSGVGDYPTHARAALAEMFRQVGDTWTKDPEGTLQSGMLIRLLVLPNDLAGIEDSLRWIAENLSPRVGISLMAQYYPAHRATDAVRYPLVSRSISAGEWERALIAIEKWMEGDHHYVQDHLSSPRYYRPDFSDPDVPFKDIEDFV